MNHLNILALILILLPSFTSAEEYVYKYILPKESPLTYITPKEGGSYANFAGEITIKANYQFIYDDGTGLPDNPYLIIYPDEMSLKLLPYLVERGKPEFANEILIHGADEIAIKLLGAELASKIKSGKYPFVSGEAEFVLTELAAGYECDQTAFVGEYKSINKIITTHKFASIKKVHGC